MNSHPLPIGLAALFLLMSACAPPSRFLSDDRVEPAPVGKLALACSDRVAPACYSLGEHFLNSDEARAEYYYGRTCHLDAPNGCYDAGYILNQRETDAAALSRAQALMKKACDGGVMKACAMIGVNYLFGRGGRTKDLTNAARYFRSACAAGEGLSCLNLGMMTFDADIEGSDVQAYGYFEQACDASIGKGCANAALLIRENVVAQPLEVALEFEARACKLGACPE